MIRERIRKAFEIVDKLTDKLHKYSEHTFEEIEKKGIEWK